MMGNLSLYSVLCAVFIAGVAGIFDCDPIGFCELCSPDDAEEAYCQAAGRKKLHFCSDRDSGVKKELYLPCQRTSSEELLLVVLFFLVVSAVAVFGFMFIQARKRLTMTAFESRKAAGGK
jgi:hypothetical protein